MRSSKSRSRNKNRNNNRPTGGNIINRVFDSQGPDGKVRGTPQQIIDKYNQLHRDAQLNGDRVDAENFAQHAEHYTRLLAEAQREIDSKREEQERQNRERQAERDRERAEREKRQTNDGDSNGDENNEGGGKRKRNDDQPRSDEQPRGDDQPRRDDQAAEASSQDDKQPDVDEGDSGLVETPEAKSDKPKPRRRRTSSKSPESNPTAAE